MKTTLFAAALMLGTAGLAQNAAQPAPQPAPQPTEQPSGETVDDPSQATGPEGVTQQGTDPNGTATAPAGTNQPTGSPMSAQGMTGATPMASTTNYPACSRTVTDRCVQTYERGVRRNRARR